MTTEKKSSLSERFKALRDKVAGAMTAAEEEESSVAGLVFPEDSVKASSAPEQTEGKTAHRASNDDVASALMKFTWAKDQPIVREQPEEVRVFYEGFQAETEPEAETEAEGYADAYPERGSQAGSLFTEPDQPEQESWEKVLAEAEALLAREGIRDTSFDGINLFDSALKSDADRLPQEEAWSYPAEDTGRDEPFDALPDLSVHEVNTAKPEDRGEAGFSWAELFGGISEGETVKPEREETEPENSESPFMAETEIRDDEAPKTIDSGFAALLAGLRRNDEEKRREDSKTNETPDISMFLQGLGDDQADSETDEFEPDPSDVARLWEPRAERIPAENTAIDPVREETHVFTEEDLKNLPKEDSGSDAEGRSQALSDYRELDGDEEGYTPRDFRPIRRRRYYRTGLVGGIMYFLFVLCISVALACFAWLAADDALSLNKEYLEAEVYVGEDMDVDQIATELQTKGLIRYRRLFSLFGKFFHAEDKIEPGTYSLSTKLDYRALIQNMHHYTGWTGEELATVKVTIPEGKTVMETFQILADHGVCPYETLMECAAKESFDYDFLEGIPKGDATRLEGYLFPDTYEFYADSTPKAAICRFLDNFGARLGDRVKEQAAAQGYTLREILTVASLIEKEAGDDLERATIASVIYNRLQSTSYPYLQIDATIQYAMGEHKEHLTNEDLRVDSPYNTYLYPGLPPGPIANPGLASIRAALNPESTGYYFYALNKNGKHEFFSSYSAFERFINSSNFGG